MIVDPRKCSHSGQHRRIITAESQQPKSINVGVDARFGE